MARHSKGKAKLATLLIVGEGPEDEAFLKYMKRLYDRRDSGQRITINAATGGSPGDIIDEAIRRHRNTDFDRRYVLLDSDIPISKDDRDFADDNNIELIESAPHCLEGMLLEILGQPIPRTNKRCKSILHPQLDREPTSHEAYSTLFPRKVLDKTTKEQIVTLRQIISNS